MRSKLALDVRHALRGLARVPATSAAAILCVALGIGATTSIYAAVHAALLRPLPFPHPEALVSVFRTTPQFVSGPFAPANFLDLERESRSLAGLGAVATNVGLLQGDDGSVRVSVNAVSGDFGDVAGTAPILGRMLGSEDTRPDAPPTAVLGEELWRDRFGADPGLLGRTIRLDGESRQVVGVLPRGFRVPHGGRVLSADLWVPLRFTPEQATRRRNNFLMLVGRLAPGRTVAAADAELRTLMDRIVAANPELNGEQLRVTPLHEESVRAVRTPLLLLLGAVIFVLLIAAANVASLLLARGVARRREWAVRTAMGAGSTDVLRGAAVESLLITGTGAVLGLALAWAGVRLIATLLPSGLPQLADLGIDPAVLLAALGLALAVGLIAGVAPVWQAQRAQPQSALRADDRSGGVRAHHAFLRGLIVAEVALSMVLLLGAGLVFRGFERLVGQDPGFDPDPLLTLTVNLAADDYRESSAVDRFLVPALDRIRAIPGVVAAGATTLIPYDGWGWNFNIIYEGRPAEDPTRLPLVETRTVSHGFFDALGMKLLRGRLFEPADAGDDAPLVVVANRALADRDFPGQDAVGRRFLVSDSVPVTIIGVVDDIKNFGPDRPPQPGVYWSVHQNGGRADFPLIIRTAGDPTRFAAPVADAVHAVDPAAAVSGVRSMRDVIHDAVGRPRFYLVLLGVFAAVALLLALAGLYGVMSYVVAQRTREIGVRSALGSTPAATLAFVLRGGLTLVALGAAAGLAGAAALTRLLQSLLYGVSPLDPVTWAAVTLLLALAAALAILIPANRAARVDPVVAMRAE